MRCEATTKRGKRCNNRSMQGLRYCGPHQDALERGNIETSPVVVRRVT